MSLFCMSVLALFKPCDWLTRSVKVIFFASHWSESVVEEEEHVSGVVYQGRNKKPFSAVPSIVLWHALKVKTIESKQSTVEYKEVPMCAQVYLVVQHDIWPSMKLVHFSKYHLLQYHMP